MTEATVTELVDWPKRFSSLTYWPLSASRNKCIICFRQGSVVVDYRIKVLASTDSDEVYAYLHEKKDALESSVIFKGYSLTDDYIKDHGNYFLRSGKYNVCVMMSIKFLIGFCNQVYLVWLIKNAFCIFLNQKRISVYYNHDCSI